MKNRSAGYCHYYKHPGPMTIEQVKAKKCGEKHCFWFQGSLFMRDIRLKKCSKLSRFRRKLR
jgi:ArsR family metal-binding transcriptional regulator